MKNKSSINRAPAISISGGYKPFIMKKIACKLIDYGYDFDYESHGSSGETIQEHMLGFKVTNYQGEVYFEHEGERETFEENEETFDTLAAIVERLIVEDTSSF